MKLFRRDGKRPMPLSERLYRRFLLKYHGRYLVADMQARAKARSLDYIEAHMRDALLFEDRWDLLLFAMGRAPAEGMMLEFGVADGASLRWLASRSARSFHGFDSFEGLPEDWSGTFERRGKFGRAGELPKVPANTSLHRGWFEATLPPFLGEHTGEKAAFVHVDCDIYSSTATVLRLLTPRLAPGTVLVFDEYFNYPNWERHEWRAFQEFVRDTGTSYEYLGFAQKNGHVAVRLGDKSADAARLAAEKLARIGG
ncbi:MAG TPA: class I SAM-dependent methyltransferase [Stellaceae bacterium]|nr:class I SAM-dependent methyltransferase [Stellaceae bacterium]